MLSLESQLQMLPCLMLNHFDEAFRSWLMRDLQNFERNAIANKARKGLSLSHSANQDFASIEAKIQTF